MPDSNSSILNIIDSDSNTEFFSPYKYYRVIRV
uniref:Uncharacterized protein n=1 Tax=Lepeophtheirus salmonis TaxID=72036 RepID=A0A0K2VJT8_LEPSM